MPIYAYRCSSCGHAKDVLQKLSDPLLTTCPACGAQAFSKQVTAAGFQLKGSGWYVTDFRGGSQAGKDASKDAAKDAAKDSAGSEPAKTDAAPAEAKSAEAKPAAAAPAAPASPTTPGA